MNFPSLHDSKSMIQLLSTLHCLWSVTYKAFLIENTGPLGSHALNRAGLQTEREHSRKAPATLAWNTS